MSFAVSSETAPLLDVLVCDPTHFEWLPVNTTGLRSLASGETLDTERVAQQHAQLVDAIASAGVAVHRIDPQPHLRYMVYTRDSSLVTPWGPVITQMRKPPRWGEYAYLQQRYEELGSPVWRHVTHGTLEGGDVSIVQPGLLVVGCSGVRTDADGAQQLCSWFDAEGWRTVVVPFDDHFCHLDLIFCMAAPGLALCLLDALPEWFPGVLSDHGIDVVPITYREALDLGANVLALGDGRVVSPAENVAVNERLRSAGLTVLAPELGELVRGGGSAHCATMPLRRADASVPGS